MTEPAWSDACVDKIEGSIEPNNSAKTRADSVESMASEIIDELGLVHTGRYDVDRARRTAALALKAQMEMAEFLSDLEGRAKGSKNTVELKESEAYFDAKESSEKKVSEAALQQLVIKNNKVTLAKYDAIEAEKEFKKWSSIFLVLKEAHIFFRNLGNGKNEWSI